MILSNPEGLSKDEAMKVIRPLASNSGTPIDFAAAATAAGAYIENNPTLLEEVGELLDKAQS